MKKIFLLIFLLLFLTLAYITISVYSDISRDESNIGSLILHDRHGKILADIPESQGYRVSYSESLDTPLVRAIIEIEDKRYYDHSGIDIIGKIGALRENIHA